MVRSVCAAIVLSIASSAHGKVTYTSFGAATSLSDSSFYNFAATDSVNSKMGWRFSPSVSGGVMQLDAVVRYASSTPLNVTFEIYGDNAGTPALLLGALTRSITQNNAGSATPVTSFTGDGSIPLIAGQTYYAVLSRDRLAGMQWIFQAGAADGVQLTQGSFNFMNPPGVWESSAVTLPNAHFPTAAFRISVPAPGAAACLALGGAALAARRRRELI